ncbi:unnamed protein product [Parnassius apollo]|uniref:(apollo) hypothetical protein n=1 Tax=Parnassius apollo TaxID=110799 RepID=A0A8S3WKV4_PARAO|nr:unnamed protein product [Parnassius apollo]
MPSQDMWCDDYHVFFDSRMVITQKQSSHLQLSPTPEDTPIELDIRDPISECSSHLGRRAIYWSQRGFFYQLSYEGSPRNPFHHPGRTSNPWVRTMM